MNQNADKRDPQAHLALYQQAISNLAEGFCMFDRDSRLVMCNENYINIYSLPPELTRPGTPHADIDHYRAEHGLQSFGTQLSHLEIHRSFIANQATGVILVSLKSGAIISIHHRNLPEGGWIATHWDVTEDIGRATALQSREDDLKLQNMRFNAAIDHMSQGLCMFDASQRLVVCNEPYARLYGLPPELTRPGTTLVEILEHRVSTGLIPKRDAPSFKDRRLELMERSKGFFREELDLADGRVVAAACHPMADGGWVATHEDITDQRQQQARIRYLARHDALTDLPNRTHFAEELGSIKTRVARGERWALLYLDLDHFKSVNDTLGHAVGDALLKEVALRLTAARRDSDIAARIGGDEFALLIGPLERADQAATIAQQIIDALAVPFLLEGHEVSIGVSVGIALAPTDGTDASSLMRNGDLALYRAKSEGRGNFKFFEEDMNAALQERRFLEIGVKAALALKQFRLVFQPLVRLADTQICGFEALLRWDHPVRGAIPPDKFISIAEELGVIVQIGHWVLREACKTAASWPEDVRIAVNLSPAQFKSRDLVAHVVAALSDSGISGNRLELEITETLLLADTELTLKTLHELRALGVRISMDDFGTGYSSLSYLRSFPFDKIKIDRSFMRDLPSEPDSRAIVEAVIGLGHSLGMETTAEGVETDAELAIVRDKGCNEVQGYLFSPPVSPSAALGLLEKFGQRPTAEEIVPLPKASKRS